MSQISSTLQILFLVGLTGTLLSFGMLNENGSYSNRVDPNVLQWNENRRLNWSDFETKKHKTSISALTASGIEYYYDCQSGVLTVDIKAIFIPEQSWVRYNSKNDYILAHEQLHFDITELHARKFRKRVKESRIDCSNLKDLDILANKVLSEWKQTQNRYDRESVHSNDEEKQNYWSKKIQKELELSRTYTYNNKSNQDRSK